MYNVIFKILFGPLGPCYTSQEDLEKIHKGLYPNGKIPKVLPEMIDFKHVLYVSQELYDEIVSLKTEDPKETELAELYDQIYKTIDPYEEELDLQPGIKTWQQLTLILFPNGSTQTSREIIQGIHKRLWPWECGVQPTWHAEPRPTKNEFKKSLCFSPELATIIEDWEKADSKELRLRDLFDQIYDTSNGKVVLTKLAVSSTNAGIYS